MIFGIEWFALVCSIRFPDGVPVVVVVGCVSVGSRIVPLCCQEVCFGYFVHYFTGEFMLPTG